MDTKVFRGALNSPTQLKLQDCEVNTVLEANGSLTLAFDIDSGTRGSRFRINIPVAAFPQLASMIHAGYDVALKEKTREPTYEEIADFVMSKVN